MFETPVLYSGLTISGTATALCRWLYPMVQAGVIDVMTWSEYYNQVKDWNPVTG